MIFALMSIAASELFPIKFIRIAEAAAYIMFSYFEKSALEELKDDICTFAQAEGLEGHGRSIKVRFE